MVTNFDLKRRVSAELGRVSESQVAELVASVSGVGDELADEDIAVRVE